MRSDEGRSNVLNGTDPPESPSAALEEITFTVCGYSVRQTYDDADDGIAHNTWTVDENDWAGQLIEDTCGGLVNPIQCALAGFDEAFNNTITAQFVNPKTGRVDEKWMSTVQHLYQQYIKTTVGPRLAVLSGKFKKELMDKYSGDEVPSFPKDGAEDNAASKEAFREKYYAAVKAFNKKSYAKVLNGCPDNLSGLNHQASQMLGGLAIPKTNTLPAVMTKDTFKRRHQGGYSVETIYPQFTSRHDKDHSNYDGSRVVVTTYYNNNGDELPGTEVRIEQPAVLKDCDLKLVNSDTLVRSLGEMKRRIKADHDKVEEQKPVECMMRLMSYGNEKRNQESKNHQTALIKGELIVHLMLQAERAREKDVNFSGHLHKLDCQVNGWGVDLFVAKLDDPYILLMRINAHLAAIKHFGGRPDIEEYKQYKRLCIAIQNESNPDQWLRADGQLKQLKSIEYRLGLQKSSTASDYYLHNLLYGTSGHAGSNLRRIKIIKALAELCKDNIDLKNENQWYVAALQGALFGCTTIGCKSDQDRGPKVEETINFLKAYLHSALPEDVLSQVDEFFNGSDLSAAEYFTIVNPLSQLNCEGVTTTRTLRGDSTAAGSKLTASRTGGSNGALCGSGKPGANELSQKELKGLATVGLDPGGLGQDDSHKQKDIPIDNLMGLIVQEGWSAKELDALGGTKLNSVVGKLNTYTSDELQAFFESKGLQPQLAVELFSQLDDNKKQSPQILLAAFQKNVRCLQYAFTLDGKQGEGEIFQAIIDKYNESKQINKLKNFGLFALSSSSAAPQPAPTVISDIVDSLEQEELRGEESEKNKIVEILKSIINDAEPSSSPGFDS